jgi:hypothetical protein
VSELIAQPRTVHMAGARIEQGRGANKADSVEESVVVIALLALAARM